jgi:hypothetical protein
MTLLPPDNDQNLVNFLKQYRPLPPPARANLEECLMQQAERIPTRSRYQTHLQWLIPTAIAACGLVAWGSYRWFNPNPQMIFTTENSASVATKVGESDIFIRQTSVSSEELETFLIESWTGAMGYTTSESPVVSSDLSWYTLVDSNPKDY